MGERRGTWLRECHPEKRSLGEWHVVRAKSLQSCPTGSSVHGILQQEYWSGLPCPPPGDLPDRGMKLGSLALQVDSLLLSHQGSPSKY